MDNEDIYINDLQTQNFPHLSNLFKFLENDKDNLNVTACYYFYKIINSLIKSDPNKILTYIYSRKDILDQLTDFCNFESINSIIKKVLNVPNEDEDVNMNFDYKFLKHRLVFYKKILKKLTDLEEKNFEGISDVFISLFEEGEYIKDSEYFLEKFFFDKEIIYDLINKILVTEDKNLINLVIFILIKIFSLDKEKEVKDETEKKTIDVNELLSDDSYDSEPTQKNNENIENYQSTRKSGDFNLSGIDKKISCSINRLSIENKTDKIFIRDNFEIKEEKMKEKEEKKIEEKVEEEKKIEEKVEEEKKENKKIEIKNLEVPCYNPVEMNNYEIIKKIEKLIPNLKNLLIQDPNKTRIQQDGKKTNFSGVSRAYKMKLIDTISKIDDPTLKNTLIEEDFLCDLLEMFINFPRNSVLHFEIYKVIENLCDFLFKTIDRASSENFLESFLDFYYDRLFFNFKNLSSKEKKKCYYIGYFNKLGIYLDKKLKEISCIYENSNFLKLKNQYLNSILKTKDLFLVEDPKKSFDNESDLQINFFIKEDKMKSVIKKNKKKKKGILLDFENSDEDEKTKELNSQALLDDLIGNLQRDSNESEEEDSEDFDNYEYDEDDDSEEDDIKIVDEIKKLEIKHNFVFSEDNEKNEVIERKNNFVFSERGICDSKKLFDNREIKSERQIPKILEFSELGFWKEKKYKDINIDKLLAEINN